jgi:hypothetical protein
MPPQRRLNSAQALALALQGRKVSSGGSAPGNRPTASPPSPLPVRRGEGCRRRGAAFPWVSPTATHVAPLQGAWNGQTSSGLTGRTSGLLKAVTELPGSSLPQFSFEPEHNFPGLALGGSQARAARWRWVALKVYLVLLFRSTVTNLAESLLVPSRHPLSRGLREEGRNSWKNSPLPLGEGGPRSGG